MPDAMEAHMVEHNEIKALNMRPPETRQPGEISTSGVVSVSTPAAIHKTVILTTRRLTLRPPHERDLDALVRLANNPRVAKNLGAMPHPYSKKDALLWINMLSKPAERQRSFAITDRYGDDFLGGCGYRPFDEQDAAVSIGYWLGEPHWGQGLAAEAAQAVIDHAFDFEPINTVWVSVRAVNHQSKRVIEKCGFQFAHSGMANSLAVHGRVAIDYYSMTRSTWESLHAWGER